MSSYICTVDTVGTSHIATGAGCTLNLFTDVASVSGALNTLVTAGTSMHGPYAASSGYRGPGSGRRRSLTIATRFYDVVFIMRAIVAIQMTLIRKHVSIASGVLSTNWLKFSWTIAVALNHSR